MTLEPVHNLKFITDLSNNTRVKKIGVKIAVAVLCLGFTLLILERKLLTDYQNFSSVIISDRNGNIIAIKPNSKGNYARYADSLPENFKKLVIEKEDKFFYFHPGINPVSALRAFVAYLKTGAPGASSTITEQLVKNLLGNEQERTVGNKIYEVAGAFALEIFLSKETILTMYNNTVYMGNQIQGFAEAAKAYFGKELAELNSTENFSLLATISNPSGLNPWKIDNKTALQELALKLGVPVDPQNLKTRKSFQAISESNFELDSLALCETSCAVTVDKQITESLRDILKRNIAETSAYGGRNGAIVAIKLPENELLSVVGTPSTKSGLPGSAINMALKPRPIGSTIKPFIYLKGFEKGLRPYTNVLDREYKFSVATGFPLYPKNYDGAYRGIITLHEALSNSLNVPTVKTLEFITLPEFYSFLEQKLGFKALQPMDSYQYGIALGGLEMTPLTLAHLMTVFPNKGELKPLVLFKNKNDSLGTIVPPMETSDYGKVIADEKYVALVNKIISDRIAGVEQFGLVGNLNLPQGNYAVKTGTSRDFHDTWTVGFTPDFLVAVWLGNVENEPMKQITSVTGAGKIWHDAMELLINSPYNKKTPFDFSKLTEYQIGSKIEYGLPDDDVKFAQNLLTEKALIINPHDKDTFSFEPGMTIILTSGELVKWYADENFIGEGVKIQFQPKNVGTYTIHAVGQTKKETVEIMIVDN
jgi:membrane carboxypeptidase/penicillin-binding protein PbpC